ncbi:family 78 glycoside hydrolase catalytic domain [Novosphingobium profundi]|uniref:alpha-L-rhamnosidase n=1 Tax=Novosphingobium profundi TaxID=1774954 RepID=UPI001BD955BE|nr:alpha-L-rhamnosidase [Novosphingobium profundi]MBT0669215.1 family 78 glycoside hydrolase catalytic domain [Novosphingobium profundi]
MPRIDRRTVLAGSTGLTLGAASGSFPALARASAGRVALRDPRTAQMVDPIGLGDRTPSLSWRLEGGEGTQQAAWRVIVASSLQRLAAGQGDVWDSGRQMGSQASGVAYAGTPLVSGQRCFWKVCAWTQDGTRVWSEPASWEMGLLEAADWSGAWLAVEDADERDDRLSGVEWVGGEAASPDVVRAFRLAFTSGAGPCVVTLVADGVISAIALDGKPLTATPYSPLAFGGPPASRFALDLAAGAHELTVSVSPTPGYFTKPFVRVAGHVRMTGADGARVRIGRGWQTRLGDLEPWAAAAKAPEQPNFPWPPTPARLLARPFAQAGKVVRARLHVAALGGYRVWINGARVGADELQAEPANYTRHIPSRSYDVTALVRDGANVLGALVGDGHFASYQAPDGRYPYLPAPRRVQMVLEIEDEGGTITRVVTDGSWRHADSPLRMSEIYAGEDQDLRLWPEGWNRAGFDLSDWERVWTAPEPQVPIVAALCEPVRVIRERAPESVHKRAERRFVVDFGQNFAGRVRLRVKGRPGQEVTVRMAEILGADGEIDQSNLRAARATDRYVLAGRREGEELCPMLTYQGFRYAEISGLDTLEAGMVTGLVLSSDLRETGTLRVAEPHIQKLWLNTLWSQRSNFMGIPTDCPQRDERLGWTGDAQVFWDTASFNMATGPFTRAYCRDLREAQGARGAYPLWAPCPSGLGWGTTSATPGWADVGVMLPYTSYLHEGDARVVDENWSAMTAYLEGILATNPDGLWAKDRGVDLGDWLALDAKSPMDETTPKDLIGTAMLARSIAQVAQLAQWTGRSAEAATWTARLARTRQAFAAAFVKPDGTVGNASQCSYILALALDLLDEPVRARAGERLAADIRRRGTLLTTGFLGTPLALDALAGVGETRLAWDLLLRREFPSWGYMADHGATTIWERWNGDTGDVAMNSFNHYALGAVCGFLYRRVAGIAPTAPGFATFDVDPLLDPRIASAGATLDTVRGRIVADWTRGAGEGGGASLALSVPANTRARVRLPGGWREVAPGTHRFTLAGA